MEKTLRTINHDPTEELISVFDVFYPRKEEIRQAFDRFMISNEDLEKFDCVRKEVAESWLRSRKYGVDRDLDPFHKKVKPFTLKGILKKNRSLIRIVNSTLSRDLAFLKHHSGFDVFLYDCNGIILTYFISKKKVKDFIGNKVDYTGYDLSEQSIGTSSHSLCMYLDRPFLIIPTENYNKTIQHVSTAVSAPIHNVKGEVIGALTFAYSEANDLYLANRSMLSGMISFQMSLANRIENGLKKRMEDLADNTTKKYSFFNTVSLLTDDILITVNKNEEILNMNSSAENLFGLTEEQCKGKNIIEVAGKETTKAIKTLKKKTSSDEGTGNFFCNIGEKKYALTLIPCDMIDGAIIRLKPYKAKTTSVAKSNSNNLSALFTFSDILGASSEILRAKQLAKEFASTPFNILILGDSGTGKELFAHAIHNESHPEGPFVTINCAAMPKELIESELFGYEGGSFTGADPKGRAGKLEMANGGTLFLDEIGDMPLDLQPLLLRDLETKRVMRIGGSRYISTNFRVIAATNKNIQELIAQNRFREDLYFRLSSLKLFIPSLKNRGSDILLLARHFIRRYCENYNRPIPDMDPSVEKVLMDYEWPGNVRELQNVIGTALCLAKDGVIRITDLPPEIFNDSSHLHDTSRIKTLEEVEERAIHEALVGTGYNINRTAQLLGISRTTLYKKIRKYNHKFPCKK